MSHTMFADLSLEGYFKRRAFSEKNSLVPMLSPSSIAAGSSGRTLLKSATTPTAFLGRSAEVIETKQSRQRMMYNTKRNALIGPTLSVGLSGTSSTLTSPSKIGLSSRPYSIQTQSDGGLRRPCTVGSISLTDGANNSRKTTVSSIEEAPATVKRKHFDVENVPTSRRVVFEKHHSHEEGNVTFGTFRKGAARPASYTNLLQTLKTSPSHYQKQKQEQQQPSFQEEYNNETLAQHTIRGVRIAAKAVDRGGNSAVSSFRSYVGAAVGMSGQKPFIRLLSRGSLHSAVMPPLAFSESTRDPVFGRALSCTYSAPFHNHVQVESSVPNVCSAHDISEPEISDRIETLEEGKKNRAAYKSRFDLQHKPLWEPQRNSVFVAQSNRPVVLATGENSTAATKAEKEKKALTLPLTRQVSQLCLTILRERDRRLGRQKVLQESAVIGVQEKTQARWEELKEQLACPVVNKPLSAKDALNTRNSREGEDREGAPGPGTAVLECVRNVLEKRRVCTRENNGVLTNRTSSAAWDCKSESGTHVEGVMEKVTVSENTSRRGSYESGCEKHSLAEPQCDMNDTDDEELGDEDPWWCFYCFWCSSTDWQQQHPPPSFVPAIRLSAVCIPDDVEALTRYQIPLPTPTSATMRRNTEAVGRKYDHSHSTTNGFTDQSDAYTDGRGAMRVEKRRARKMQISMLLLETCERRARRLMTQQEITAWKVVTENIKS